MQCYNYKGNKILVGTQFSFFITDNLIYFSVLEWETISASVGERTVLSFDDREGAKLHRFIAKSNCFFSRWKETSGTCKNGEKFTNIAGNVAPKSEWSKFICNWKYV